MQAATRRPRLVSSLGCLVLVMLLAGVAAATARATTPGVDPPSVSATLNPGGSITIPKVVHTPAIPPNPDVIFVADTTSSMSGAIANVQSQAGAIMAQVRAAQPTADFGVASYTDQACPNPYTLEQ